MCLMTIVDTNVLWKIAPKQEHQRDDELCSWIRQGHGILVYCNEGKYFKELCNSERVFRVFAEYRRGQKAKLIENSALENARIALIDVPIRSDDRHMLELSLAGDALVLCSKDKKLKKDFVNPGILPDVEQKPREIYPIDQSLEKRVSFLRTHQCPSQDRADRQDSVEGNCQDGK